MVNKVEKQLVYDYLQELYVKYKTEKIPLNERYNELKKFKLSSNTTVLCLNCLVLRHKKDKKRCCDKSPLYDLTTSYRIILEHIQGEFVEKVK